MEPHSEGVDGPLYVKAERLVIKLDPAGFLDRKRVQKVHDGDRREIVQLF